MRPETGISKLETGIAELDNPERRVKHTVDKHEHRDLHRRKPGSAREKPGSAPPPQKTKISHNGFPGFLAIPVFDSRHAQTMLFA